MQAINKSRDPKRYNFAFLISSDINRTVQSQKKARKLEILHLSQKRDCTLHCSETKDGDQLCSYCTADLHLWFRICRLFVF